MRMEQQEVARAVGLVMKDLVSRATAPLLERIAVLESRLDEVVFQRGERGETGPAGRDGINGKDADEDRIVERLTDVIGDRFSDFERAVKLPKDGRDGVDGKDAQVHARDIMSAVVEYLELHPIPVPKDGRDGRDGKDGRDGLNGKDADVKAQEGVDEAVAAYLELHPPARGLDGKDGANGKDGVDGRDGVDGEPGVDGKDGVDGKSIDIEDVTPILEGLVAKAVLDIDRRASDTVQKAIERIPPPQNGKDGKDGADGIDGFGLDDFDFAVKEDGRTAVLSFTRGERRIERTIKIAGVKYREIWKDDIAYEVGDLITFDGSMWAALKDNVGSRPGEFNKTWRLAVKRGRNGKTPESKS
jgi:hypothetical protein